MALDPHTARSIALNESDRAASRQKGLFFAVATVELLFIVAFLLLADFSNRLHVLLFLSTMTVYTTLGLGLIILAIRLDGGVRRLVSAIDAGVSKL
jgi:hypothetical protein